MRSTPVLGGTGSCHAAPLHPRVERVYELARSLKVITGTGLDMAEQAASFRRETARQRNNPTPAKYLQPDERSEHANYFLIQHEGKTIATSRIVTRDPLGDLSATVLDKQYTTWLRELQIEGRLGSIGRMWSSVGGELGSAASWVTYRAMGIDGPAPRPYFVSELSTLLRRRLKGIGVDCTTIGVTSIPGLRVEPVLIDVHSNLIEILGADSGFARFLDEALEIDLRD